MCCLDFAFSVWLNTLSFVLAKMRRNSPAFPVCICVIFLNLLCTWCHEFPIKMSWAEFIQHMFSPCGDYVHKVNWNSCFWISSFAATAIILIISNVQMALLCAISVSYAGKSTFVVSYLIPLDLVDF
jgi:hypothetical protein